jgi:hypothetical protein
MNRTIWTGIIVAIIFGGGGFYGGMQYQAGQKPAVSAAGRFGGAGGAGFAGRGAGGFAGAGAAGGATFGTIIAASPTSITIQLPTSTSTTATTGTKIVLLDNATQISAMESVPPSSLKVGQSVTVAGTPNSDGSVTASTVQVRPATTGRTGGQTPTTPTSAQ